MDNNKLIDSMVKDKYIKSPGIEKVFRFVDRANYFLPGDKGKAYERTAYKSGNIHLSSPDIYYMVLENLQLHAGLSFLNIGSGTGYLSTIAGLLIGRLGVNHGVEVYADVVEYASQKLKEFNTKILSSLQISLTFGEPVFVKGNGLCLPDDTDRYDRVYCGATCPENYKNYMKNLIKVGGVLVMPYHDELLRITRISENQWEQRKIAGVIFSSLLAPSIGDSIIAMPRIVNPELAMGRIENPTKELKPQLDFSVITIKKRNEKSKLGIGAAGVSTETTGQNSSGENEDNRLRKDMDDGKDQLLENFKQVTIRLQELIECPVCFGALDSALIQCKNGHGICGSCASKIEKCPSCKMEFVVHKSTLLSKILEYLPKLCLFVDKGCKVIVLDKDHETFCKFRPSVCKNTLCCWSGCVKDLIDHVKTCENRKMCEITPDSQEPQCFAIDKTQSMFFYIPVIFQSQLFWEYFHRDAITKRITYRFYHVATSKPTSTFYFKVSFKKGKIEYTHSYKALLDDEDNQAGNGDESGLIFTDSELERFQSQKESDTYEYTIAVVTEDTA